MLLEKPRTCMDAFVGWVTGSTPFQITPEIHSLGYYEKNLICTKIDFVFWLYVSAISSNPNTIYDLSSSSNPV